MMRIAVSGGGSAGHITPALATCDALKSLDSSVELLYIGQAAGMEARIVKMAGLQFAPIQAGKFRRNHFDGTVAKFLNPQTLGPNVRDLGRTLAGVAQAQAVLRRFKPSVVFLKGGFVSLPVGVAAKLLRIPYVVHESDVSPGLANRILGRWAEKIAVGWPVKNYQAFDPARLVYVGNPVRTQNLQAHRLEGLAYFKLEEDVPVLFVTGGSQGAAQINNVVLDALPQLLERYQIIHQTGEGELNRVKFELSRRKLSNLKRYHPYAFILKEMGAALAVSDLIIGRAGLGTINDSAMLGKPTVLIPNYQMAGHQVENARILSRAGAVRVLNGAKLTPEQLVGEINRIMEDPAEQERLSVGIRAFARPQAARELAELILAVGHARDGGGAGIEEGDQTAERSGGGGNAAQDAEAEGVTDDRAGEAAAAQEGSEQ